MRTHRSQSITAIILCAVASVAILAGCGGGGGTSGGPQFTSVSRFVFRNQGGNIVFGSGTNLASLSIQPNALGADTTITIGIMNAGTFPALPSGLALVSSNVYDFSPDSTTFNPRAALFMGYDPTRIPAGFPAANLQLYTVTGGVWQPVTSTVDTGNQVVSSQVAQIGIYAVLGPINGSVASPTATLIRATGISGGIGTPGAAPTGLTATNYVPVVIQVQATTGNIPQSQFLEYHIYRKDLAQVTGTVPSGFGAIPVAVIHGNQALVFNDDGNVKSGTVSKPSPSSPGTLLLVTLSNQTPGTDMAVGLVGQRFQYFVEGLWTEPAFGYEMTPLAATNFVTYLQPADLQSASFTGPDAFHVSLTIPATLAADDYVLQVSTDVGFGQFKSYTPFSPGTIQAQSATQANPREGTAFSFFDPAHPWNAAADFPAATSLFARIGVRDSRNGSSNTSNPYLFCDPVQIPNGLI